jgi:hypothetical protein
MFLLALLLQHFDETLWLKCHIQWLYLAVHGCKTYLNLNLNLYVRYSFHLCPHKLSAVRMINGREGAPLPYAYSVDAPVTTLRHT